MTEKRMTCWQCPRYNRAERRCLDSKANPKRKTDSVAVAEFLGVDTLCHYNPYRDGIALRMYFPRNPLAVGIAVKRRQRDRRNTEAETPVPQ